MYRVVVVTNLINKELKMNIAKKIAISVATFIGLGLTVVTVYAQQGPFGNGMGQGMMRGGMMQGQMAGSMTGQNSDMKVMRELMTPAERLALMDKMIDAKTPEERQAIITANHTEMEKRAKDKGITLPAGHGPYMIWGRNCG